MKNVSRNKFLLCFKPVVDMDQLVLDRSKVGVGDHSARQAVKHLAREKKKMDHMKRLVPNSSLLSDDNYDTEMISSSENSLVLHSSKEKLISCDQDRFLRDLTVPESSRWKSTNPSRPRNVIRSLWLPEKEENKDQRCYKKKVIMEGLLERTSQRVNGIKFST
ncbi:hypothetical protein OIU76_015889 [Salix suchowensis]|nr:hypothetical protein OIU76_015889 [Salix suchowensis]